MKKEENEEIRTPRRRRTQEERKADTRASLLEVGRRHFLRDGLSGASGEKIAEEAGFSRGALHANFGDKEGLFLEIVKQADDVEWKKGLHLLKQADKSTSQRLQEAQELFVDMLDNPSFVLRLELEVQSLHHPELRSAYRELFQSRKQRTLTALEEFVQLTGASLRCSQEEAHLLLTSVLSGMSMLRRILGRSLPRQQVRQALAVLFAVLFPPAH